MNQNPLPPQFPPPPPPIKPPRVTVRRLNPYPSPKYEKEIARALPGLYDVDETFPKIDRYRLKLLLLALRQPDALWVAYVNGKAVGYFSIYRMTNKKLFDSLKENAAKGTLDLPDFSGKLVNSVDPRRQNRVPKSESMYFYIDALVVKEEYRRIGGTLIAHSLIDKAKADLARVIARTDIVATIAVNKKIENFIALKWPDLKPIGQSSQKTKNGCLYRHLYIQDSSQ